MGLLASGKMLVSIDSLNVTPDGDVGTGGRRFFPDEETDRILREELGSANVNSTPRRAVWPIYTKTRSRVLSEQEEPLCKAVMFDVSVGVEQLEASNCQRGMLLTRVRVCPRVL